MPRFIVTSQQTTLVITTTTTNTILQVNLCEPLSTVNNWGIFHKQSFTACTYQLKKDTRIHLKSITYIVLFIHISFMWVYLLLNTSKLSNHKQYMHPTMCTKDTTLAEMTPLLLNSRLFCFNLLLQHPHYHFSFNSHFQGQPGSASSLLLRFSSSTSSRKEPLGISGTSFYRPNFLSVIQPTVSICQNTRNWPPVKEFIQLPCPLLIHCPTPQGKGVVLFMLALWHDIKNHQELTVSSAIVRPYGL